MVTASILWGLTLSSRLIRRRGVPAWLLDLHRYLGTLSIVFTVVHLLGLVADNYVHFGWSELFVPMSSPWQPGNVAWGIAAFYVLVAIQITSWLMRRMPRRLWHSIHLTSVVLFITATIHGFRAGADRGNRLVEWGAFACITLVIAVAIFRLLTLKPRRRSGVASTPRSGGRRVAPELVADDPSQLAAR
jgi:DMSO/TMAO reductase YedYZ heme-binding membrane subunit